MAPERAAIDRQLDAIFASEAFSSAPKMRALLRYLVDATLAGDEERLKGYAIGVDVFERGAGFDPGSDPIVRVQAGRLRKLLEAYYTTTGRDDAVRIDIPKGAYAVTVTSGSGDVEPDAERASGPVHLVRRQLDGWRGLARRPALLATAGTALAVLGLVAALSLGGGEDARSPAPEIAKDAITLAILPFADMSQDGANGPFADGLTDALTTALARVKTLAVASRTSAFQYRDPADLRDVGGKLGVRYLVEGGLQRDRERMRVNVQLIDALSGAHIWAQHYDRAEGDSLDVQSELVMTLAAEIRPQLLNAAKRAMEARPAQPATAWQLYIQSTWTPGEAARNSLAWEKERVALATRALDLDPDLGQAHSVLSDKLAYLANVDPPSDTEDARAKAAEHARRALDLAPGDADAVFNVSIHHWHAGRIQEAEELTRRTLELDPNHVLARFLVKSVPYTCAAAPQDVIDELTAFDGHISADNPVRWVTLTWISLLYLNGEDLARAVDFARRADQIFRTPDTVYRLAAILVGLGEAEEAVALVAELRSTWPNLDPRHYAEVAIPRRCGSAPKSAYLRGIYGALAEAVEARHGG